MPIVTNPDAALDDVRGQLDWMARRLHSLEEQRPSRETLMELFEDMRRVHGALCHAMPVACSLGGTILDALARCEAEMHGK